MDVDEKDWREKTPAERFASLPPHLRFDRKKIKELQSEQKRLAEIHGSPFAARNSADYERGRAPLLLDDAKKTEAGLMAQLIRGVDQKTSKLIGERLDVARAQQAEAHAAMGRFDLAAITDPDKGRAGEYLAVHEAVMRDDAEECPCGTYNEAFPVTQDHVEKDIFSVKHLRVMPVVRCNNCGFRNVKALPRELKEQREHRATAVQLSRGGMKPDAVYQQLVKMGHTSHKLLIKK